MLLFEMLLVTLINETTNKHPSMLRSLAGVASMVNLSAASIKLSDHTSAIGRRKSTGSQKHAMLPVDVDPDFQKGRTATGPAIPTCVPKALTRDGLL